MEKRRHILGARGLRGGEGTWMVEVMSVVKFGDGLVIMMAIMKVPSVRGARTPCRPRRKESVGLGKEGGTTF